jgi:D-serine deaminase-like pyridoxal phosphate-dependent protein
MSDKDRSTVDEYRQRMLRVYGGAIGQHRSELITPALVLDLASAKRNIQRMADEVRHLRADIRPHIKAHKSPDLARLQVEAGAIGLSTATVWEAIVLVRSGLDHVFVVNTIAGPQKIRALAELASEADVMVAIDDAANAEQLAAAMRAAGSTLGVLIEVDTGMDRAGVDTPQQALDLAKRVTGMRRLELRGLTGYEGHCSLTPDAGERHVKEQQAMSLFIEIADLLEANGIPTPIRSAGGTATWNWTAAFPGITEVQAGTYVVMDAFHGRMIDGFEHSMTVQATVISRPPDRVVVDVGSKSIGDGEISQLIGPQLPVVRFDEEHGIFDASGGSGLKVGDVVGLVPGYSPSTVNWYDAFHVVEDDIVIDIWPVIPRGPGHNGLVEP